MRKKLIQILKNKRGFTLIEMILVLIVIAVLMLLIIPNISKQRANVDKQGTEALVKVVETQVEMYQLDHSNQVPSFDELKGDYLSDKQVKNAKDKGINIDASGKVTGP